MALTESNSLELGTIAPEFVLLDTTNNRKKCLNEVQGRNGLIVIFMCNHCPFVVHIKELLGELHKEFIMQGVGFAAISSNDIEAYPEDSPEHMSQFMSEMGYTFPYLYDETQQTAKDYAASCTPDVYYFGKRDELVYHGQFDNSRPGNGIAPSGDDLRAAITLYLEKGEALAEQKPSVGCSIKWK